MCEFTQREYSCGHFKFIAARWCHLYRRTHRRCVPDVVHFEYRANEICGQCRPHVVPPWQHRVRSNAPVSLTGITGINSLDDCCKGLNLTASQVSDYLAIIRVSKPAGRPASGTGTGTGSGSGSVPSSSASTSSSSCVPTCPSTASSPPASLSSPSAGVSMAPPASSASSSSEMAAASRALASRALASSRKRRHSSSSSTSSSARTPSRSLAAHR